MSFSLSLLRVQIVIVEVDADLPENKDPKPQLEVGTASAPFYRPLIAMTSNSCQFVQLIQWKISDRYIVRTYEQLEVAGQWYFCGAILCDVVIQAMKGPLAEVVHDRCMLFSL